MVDWKVQFLLFTGLKPGGLNYSKVVCVLHLYLRQCRKGETIQNGSILSTEPQTIYPKCILFTPQT